MSIRKKKSEIRIVDSFFYIFSICKLFFSWKRPLFSCTYYLVYISIGLMRKYSSSIVHNSSTSIYCDIYIQAKICFYLLQKTIFSSISLILQSAKWGYFIWNEIYVQWNTSSSSFLEMNFGTISKFQKLKQNLQNILLFK